MTRRGSAALLQVLVVVALLLAGCSSGGSSVPDPREQVDLFAGKWARGDYSAASALTSDPLTALKVFKSVGGNLSPSAFDIAVKSVDRTSDTAATVTATLNWTLDDAGTWSYDVQWPWSYGNGGWRLNWASTDVHPQLGEQQSLAVRITKPTDGVVVDRDNTQLFNPVRVYSVLALKDQITDVAGTAAALQAALQTFDTTLTADSIAAGITATAAGGAYPVVNLREPDYQAVADRLTAIAGVSTPSEVRNLPPTKDFAKQLLSQVSKTATAMTAGIPGWRVVTIDATGTELTTLDQQQAKNGDKVVLTLDQKVQMAADAAVTIETQPTTIVAIQPSTGEILAVAQNGAADALGPIALSGRYPPGSTFKVITATAGIDHNGLTPTTQVPCPDEVDIDGRAITNAHDYGFDDIEMSKAFSFSCNTTFAQVASGLPADGLTNTAKQYGVGLDFDVTGIITLTGQSPPADSVIQRAENGFGQGTDLLTPFSEALMAATVAHGSMPMPVLIRGTTTTVDQPPPARSAAASSILPVLMRRVVDDGSAQQLKVFGDQIFAKTGTAEFVDDTGATHAHAWTIGYIGDLAFSAFIEGGEDSARSNELVVQFLNPLLGN